MKSSTKELICAVLVLALLAAIAALAGCTPVWHGAANSGRVIYNRDGVSFNEELTAEEVETVKSILNGKKPESIFQAGYACGYDERQALQIGSTTYYLAQDDCGYIQNAFHGKYYELTNDEHDALEAILKAHGAVYCDR